MGYRVRFGSKISRATRIEVVTEGVFTRLVLDDPSLAGVAAVLFDEFHERSLDGDLGLALARDAQQGLREDLKLLVMTITHGDPWGELYDLSNDPHEMDNLFEDPGHRQVRTRLMEELAYRQMELAERSPLPIGRA